jgi:hypothetical protein
VFGLPVSHGRSRTGDPRCIDMKELLHQRVDQSEYGMRLSFEGINMARWWSTCWARDRGRVRRRRGDGQPGQPHAGRCPWIAFSLPTIPTATCATSSNRPMVLYISKVSTIRSRHIGKSRLLFEFETWLTLRSEFPSAAGHILYTAPPLFTYPGHVCHPLPDPGQRSLRHCDQMPRYVALRWEEGPQGN